MNRKTKVVHPYNELLLSNIKKESTDTCIDIGEHQKHFARLKKPGAEDYTLYDFIHMKGPEKAKL